MLFGCNSKNRPLRSKLQNVAKLNSHRALHARQCSYKSCTAPFFIFYILCKLKKKKKKLQVNNLNRTAVHLSPVL